MRAQQTKVAYLRWGSYLSPQVLPAYQAIVSFLGTTLGIPGTLVETSTLDDLSNGQLDLAFLCGAQYLQLAEHDPCPVTLLAAPVLRGRRYQGQPWYFSDVVVQASSPFESWADLRGTRFGINEPGSHSGYAIVQEHLRQQQQDWHYFAEVIPTGSHAQSIHDVISGAIDAAAIDSQVLDVYRQRHRAVAKQLRRIAMLGPSTVPPIVVRRDLPRPVVKRLQQALVGMHEDPALRRQLHLGAIKQIVAVVPAAYRTMRDTWQRTGCRWVRQRSPSTGRPPQRHSVCLSWVGDRASQGWAHQSQQHKILGPHYHAVLVNYS